MSSSTPHDSDYDVAMTSLQPGWLSGNGRYTLIRLVGRGGMGMVWLAEDHQLQEQVALKFLPPEIGLDANALEDFKRETTRARKLTHPNIVRIHDFFKGEHEAFISMEFVDGAHLHDLCLSQPNQVFSWKDLEPLIIQLCEALDYAHKEGVIHRDIKPANLMVDQKGRLKLTDFGFSARVTGNSGDLPSRHVSSGTIPYMSPAQFAGGIPCVADDLYSLGATIYELLTGTPPFKADETPYEIRTRLPTQMAERLAERSIQNEIPASVNALVMACLANEPLRRPGSAGLISETLRTPELKPNAATDVESIHPPEPAETPVQTENTSPTEVQTPVVAEQVVEVVKPVLPPIEDPVARPEPQLAQPRSRRGFGVAVAALVGIVLLAGIGWFAWSRLQSRQNIQPPVNTAAMDLEATTNAPAGEAPDKPAGPRNPRRQGRQPAVKFQTVDLLVSGNGFKVMDFNEGTNAFSNRKYFWRQIPEKFRGWNFTQMAFEAHPRIQVRAQRDTDVYIAAAFPNTMAQSEMVIPDWQPEGSTFNYNGRNIMMVFRKHLEASEEIDVPRDPKYSFILLFPK